MKSSTIIVREIKSRIKRWVGNAFVRGRRETHKGFLVGKVEGKRLL